MLVYTTIADYNKYREKQVKKHRSVAFVPTMGALHEGHLALIDQAATIADQVVVSIYVNPTQFNHKDDLIRYPRPLARDIHLLSQKSADTLFLPTNDEVYPPGKDVGISIDLEGLDKTMEGKFRPGHFDGVITVVHRLLKIIRPEYIVMGQKDFQQMTIIRRMIDKCSLNVKLIPHQIVRESDGLALSSRNVRIDQRLRPEAPSLYKALQQAYFLKASMSPIQVRDICVSELEKTSYRLEYFEIVDACSLVSITAWSNTDQPIACVAAWLGDVRLIDNMSLI